MNPKPEDVDTGDRERHPRGHLYALEICFLGLVAVIVVFAFVEALSYKLVSSRTPFVIMAPLIVLILIHGLRIWRVRADFRPGARLREALSGKVANLNKVLGISGWMIAMVAMILILGHYAGIFLFCVILMRFLAGEKWWLTLVLAGGTTFFIFGVFEYVFNVDLYRGLIVRYYLGFRDF